MPCLLRCKHVVHRTHTATTSALTLGEKKFSVFWIFYQSECILVSNTKKISKLIYESCFVGPLSLASLAGVLLQLFPLFELFHSMMLGSNRNSGFIPEYLYFSNNRGGTFMDFFFSKFYGDKRTHTKPASWMVALSLWFLSLHFHVTIKKFCFMLLLPLYILYTDKLCQQWFNQFWSVAAFTNMSELILKFLWYWWKSRI